MSFLACLITALCALSNATPTPTFKGPAGDIQRLAERRSLVRVTDVATLGYATLNGGTSGGSGGNATTTVSTLPQFTAAVNEKNNASLVVIVNGTIRGDTKVRIGSNKTIIGLPGAELVGVGLHFRNQKNLIIRNLKSSFVTSKNGDGLTIEKSTNVWVDHCEFHSTLSSDKDYYDGLLDVTHGSDFITISNTYFHDHWKTSLVGHSDRANADDTGHLRVTYANNHWENCNSRGPSVRFGTVHIFNSFYENMHSAINTRMGAQVLIESNVFKNVSVPITSQDSSSVGYATLRDNDLDGGVNKAPAGKITSTLIPYNYTLLGSGKVVGSVRPAAGATLTF
ncbi:Pectin lyase fold/virulence factor [Rhypophila sp. PSN 637]